LFLRLKFPEYLDAAVVPKAAADQKVAFVPGEPRFGRYRHRARSAESARQQTAQRAG
jgi:hypothetical protein